MSPAKGKPLLEYYVKRYEEENGERPVINRNKKVWAFADMYTDLGQEAYKVIDYFFKSYEKGYHDVDRLMYNYDDLLIEMRDAKTERERRLKVARETAERVKNG